MKRARALACAALVGLSAGLALPAGPAAAAQPSADGDSARVRLLDADGVSRGTVTFFEMGGHLRVRVDASGLRPGFHGFHVHEVGSCEPAGDTAFGAAGPHLGASGNAHRQHGGDLPPLLAGADGVASAFFDTDRILLADLIDQDGSAVIVHAEGDNLANIPERYASGEGTGPDALTRATGDGGARVACGVVEPVADSTDEPAAATEQAVQAMLVNASGGPAGTVTVDPTTSGSRISLDVSGLTPGFHGLTITAAGRCEIGASPPFTSAGEHIGSGPHGQHDGDLPPLLALADGTARIELLVEELDASELLDGDGSAVVIAAGPDNLAHVPGRYGDGHASGPDAATLHDGDAGDRVLCGALQARTQGAYAAVTPTRLRAAEPLGPGATTQLQVTGRAGVPATGVSAVVLTLTVTGPSASSHLTVFPAGTTRPATSVLNYVKGLTVATTVLAKVGMGGQVSLYNESGTTRLIIDVAGWFSDKSAGAGNHYRAVAPIRLRGADPVAARATIDVPVTGRAGIPASGVAAVALTITVTAPSATGHLTAFPTGEPRPTTSIINWTRGRTVATSIIAPVGTDGTVSLFNANGTTRVIVDVSGWFGVGDATGRYSPVLPSRLRSASIAGEQTQSLPVTGRDGVPASGVSAVVLTLTVTGGSATSHLVAYAGGEARPSTSVLNWVRGQTIATTVIVPVGRDGRVTLYSRSGTVRLIADVTGYFTG